jgi:hypothetical protein
MSELLRRQFLATSLATTTALALPLAAVAQANLCYVSYAQGQRQSGLTQLTGASRAESNAATYIKICTGK